PQEAGIDGGHSGSSRTSRLSMHSRRRLINRSFPGWRASMWFSWRVSSFRYPKSAMRLLPRAPIVLLSLVLSFVGIACGPGPSLPPGHATGASPKPSDGLSDEPLPLDARVKNGKLANGLTYYVLEHKKPEHRAQVWLAVNAGSVLEDEDQRGL